MKNNIHVFFISIFFASLVHGQTNLVGNPSFETGPGTPYCRPSDGNANNFDQIDYNIDFWRDAETNVNQCDLLNGNTCRVNSGWVDYNNAGSGVCTGMNPQPHLPGNNRFIWMAGGASDGQNTNGDGIRIAISTLVMGHTYKLKYRFAASATPAGLRIFFTKNEKRWDEDPNTSQNQILEINGVLAQNVPSFQNLTWYSIQTSFTVPVLSDYSALGNLVFFNDYNHGNSTQWCFLDDVELYDEGCCADHMLFENTQTLSTKTEVIDYIRAGYDAGIPNTAGNVNVLSGQNVTFQADMKILLEPGFYAQPGSIFKGVIAPCSNQFNGNGDIIVPFLPNVFTPNGDGTNDNLCLNVTGASYYNITVVDRWGAVVFTGQGNVTSSFQCVWNGICNGFNCTQNTIVSDGTYYYVVRFSNCNNSQEFANSVYVSSHAAPNGKFLSTEPTKADSKSNSDSYLGIFPNPSTGLFTLFINENVAGKIFIYNNLGQVVYQSKITGSQSSIDLSTQPKGIYFVKIQSLDPKGAGKVYTEKVVVQ